MKPLQAQLADARAAQAEAEQYAARAWKERDSAWEHAHRLARRLAAVDGDRLRAERDDLAAENATLRARLLLGGREELLRAREAIAALTARLEAIEADRVTL